jgi:hypothetical protein
LSSYFLFALFHSFPGEENIIFSDSSLLDLVVVVLCWAVRKQSMRAEHAFFWIFRAVNADEEASNYGVPSVKAIRMCTVLFLSLYFGNLFSVTRNACSLPFLLV